MKLMTLTIHTEEIIVVKNCLKCDIRIFALWNWEEKWVSFYYV